MMRQFMKPERIRIIAVLAIFNYIFLGSEYLFDNMIRYATDSAGVVRAQNYVLGISVIGFLLFPCINRYFNQKMREIGLYLLPIAGIICIFVIQEHLCYRSMLLSGFLLYILYGMIGSAVHYYAVVSLSTEKGLAQTVGFGYAFGLLLQFMPCYCPFYAKGAVEPVGEVADEIEDTAPKKEKKEKKQRIASTYVRGKHYEKLNAEDCRQMLLYIADKILANEPYLTEVDSAIGDGDHGIGMATGMKNVKEVLLDMEGEKNVYSIFEEAGKAMLLSMGGASGVIFGSLYLEGALGTESKDYLTAEDLKAMEEKSLKAIQERGKASVGDKTMVDALAPAVEAMQQHYTEGLEKMLEEAEAGALRGVENTKDCIARFGRAKSLGERALGFQDAGATSTWLIFQSMREFVKGE